MYDADPPAMPDPAPPHGAARRTERHLPLTILALCLLVIVAIVQRPGAPDPLKIAAARTGSEVEPVSVSPLIGMGRGFLWYKTASPTPLDERFITLIDESAHTAADKFRAALLIGELVDAEARDERLELLEEKLAPDSPLREDIATVRALEAAEAGQGEAPDDAAKDGLLQRHGWFARLFLARGDTASGAAFRAAAESYGFRLFLILAIFGMGVLAAIAAGFVVLIIAIVQAATGRLRPRFTRTPPDLGSDRGLWLETFAAFLAAFLVIHFLGLGLSSAAKKGAAWPSIVVLLLQWGIAPVILWPLLRGMSWERYKGEVGWHRGRGFFREVGAGVLGYLAGLPIYFMMAVVIAVLTQIQEAIRRGPGGGPHDDVPLPDSKVMDLVSGSGGLVLLLLGTLIVVWAPLVEETVFRGALYRHIRTRWGMLFSALFVAAAFAMAHAYVLAGVVMVATLGAIFALMREWRGSLIAPITAHCMHNSMVLTLLVTLLPFMRG